MRKKDLEKGIDKGGDIAIFIEERHFQDKGWEVDNTTKKYLQLNMKHAEDIFFRVIKSGVQQSGHGWINKQGEVIQWG
jgi:hypothetical protein